MTSKIEKKFGDLLGQLTPLLREEGFAQHDATFARLAGEMRHFVDFQRSRRDNEDEIKFTINIGVLSNRLHDFLWSETPAEPTVWHCHINRRIGFLLPQKEDRWWTMSRNTSHALLSAEIAEMLRAAVLPFLRQFAGDDDLRRHLRSLLKGGNATYEEAVNLCALEAMRGQDAEFIDSLNGLKKVGYATGLQGGDISQKLAIMLKLRESRANRFQR